MDFREYISFAGFVEFIHQMRGECAENTNFAIDIASYANYVNDNLWLMKIDNVDVNECKKEQRFCFCPKCESERRQKYDFVDFVDFTRLMDRIKTCDFIQIFRYYKDYKDCKSVYQKDLEKKAKELEWQDNFPKDKK